MQERVTCVFSGLWPMWSLSLRMLNGEPLGMEKGPFPWEVQTAAAVIHGKSTDQRSI